MLSTEPSLVNCTWQENSPHMGIALFELPGGVHVLRNRNFNGHRFVLFVKAFPFSFCDMKILLKDDLPPRARLVNIRPRMTRHIVEDVVGEVDGSFGIDQMDSYKELDRQNLVDKRVTGAYQLERVERIG